MSKFVDIKKQVIQPGAHGPQGKLANTWRQMKVKAQCFKIFQGQHKQA